MIVQRRATHRRRSTRLAPAVLVVALTAFTAPVMLSACRTAKSSAPAPETTTSPLLPGPKPPAAPQQLVGLLGEYDAPTGMRVALEAAGALHIADTTRNEIPLTLQSRDEFIGDRAAIQRLLGVASDRVRFVRATDGRAADLLVGDRHMPRRNIEPAPGTNQLRVTPVRPVAELRREALATSPPHESGTFHPA